MKRHNILSILCAVLLFGAVLISPAFADMKKVNEGELAQARVSAINVSVINSSPCVAKDGTCVGKDEKVPVSPDKEVAIPSPTVNQTKETDASFQNSSIHGTMSYGIGNLNSTGGIKSVNTR